MERALARGAVKMCANENGLELFYFPQVHAGKKKSVADEQTVSRSKAVSSKTRAICAEVIQELKWGIETTQKKLQDQDPFALNFTKTYNYTINTLGINAYYIILYDALVH